MSQCEPRVLPGRMVALDSMSQCISRESWLADVLSACIASHHSRGSLYCMRLTAVETQPALDVDQDGTNHSQGGTLTAEEELVQVDGLTEDVQVLLPHLAQPCTTYQIRDQEMELTKTAGDQKLLLPSEVRRPLIVH